MIIHRGITAETAFVLNLRNGLVAYVDEDIAKQLDQMFGPKNGDWSINSKHTRKDMTDTKYIIIQLEDKDKDQHTIFFRLNNI